MPTFSVIVTTYNRASLVGRALESVLTQTFGDFELIVADDGSTDETRWVVEAVRDPRIRYMHQTNEGLSVARNQGVRLSRGRYVTFLDDDDEAFPRWLEAFAGALEQTASGIACCGALYVSEKEPVGKIYLPRNMGSLYENQMGFFRSGTYAFRRELFQVAGGYAKNALRSQNTEFAMRLVPACISRGWVVRCIHEPLVKIHRHERPPDYYRAKFIGARHILERHRERLETNPAHLSTYWAIAGVNAARMGVYREARRSFVQAIRAQPRSFRNYARLVVSLFPPLGSRIWRPSRSTRID